MHRITTATGLALAALAAGCATAPKGPDLNACAAYAPAFEVTDRFMTSFNTKNAQAWGETFNFPSIRIASTRPSDPAGCPHGSTAGLGS